MAKIPDRFLGFSFSVGDILIEADTEFNILNVDGAASEIGLSPKNVDGLSFLELLSEDEKETFDQLSSSIKSSNRIGPINFWLGFNGKNKKKYATFIGKLPDDPKRLFIVLMATYRLGTRTTTANTDSYEETTENFIDKVEDILTEYQGQDKNLNITLLETMEDLPEGDERLGELDELLNKYSTGGNMAGRLNDNSYAVVHAKEPDGLETKDLIRELTKSTGLELNTATIDADQGTLAEEDGVRALIFSLQQFAEKSEGFDVESLANGYEEIVEDTAGRVQHLRNILNEGDFTLVYQPIVSLKTKEVHHSEALIRFNDPDLHDLQFETICFAEKVGLIQEFDTAIFKRAVEKIDEIKKTATPPKLSVNMSGRSLSSKGFLEDLKKRLKDHIHLKEYISIEITESAEITNLDLLAEVIDEIRDMGFLVYLDDFGAGAAGFRYLRELSVDGVKIDGDYVRDALTDNKIRAFLRSIVMLCNDLEIETIAEWVETDEQAELLLTLGVTYAQGYLYGRPNAGISTKAMAS